jgi:hypothetical protein
MRKLFSLAVVLAFVPVARAETLNGRWDATVTIKDVDIPFRIDFSGEGSKFTGTVFNGDLPVASTDGHFENGALAVSFGHYLSKLEATVKEGQLEGKLSGRFERARSLRSMGFGRFRTTAPRVRNPGTSSCGKTVRKWALRSSAWTAIPVR